MLWLFAALLCIASLEPTNAVDRSKFRTCAQTGFCRRHRDKIPKIQFKTSRLVQQGTKYVAELLPVGASHGLAHYHPLVLEVEVYNTKVVRARVIEGPKLSPRWENPDVLLPPRPSCPSLSVSTSDDGKISTFECEEDAVLIVHHETFRLDLVLDGQVITSANPRDMFYFEQQQMTQDAVTEERGSDMADAADAEPDCEVLDWGEDGKPIYAEGCTKLHADSREEQSADEKEVEEACDGCFEESFGGHTDSKPHGPMSVGVDISFPGAEHVYGIPEHATKMALKSTNGGTEAYNEPYRLYNLDVFEYELDVPMALYGSVPVMLAHSTGGDNIAPHTAGIFWHNPSETFVDVRGSGAGKETHWMSESGIFDLFMMRGPSAADVLSQYASLTGTQALPPMFALAYHQCRWNYRDEPDVYQVDSQFEAHDFPYDVLWLDIEHTDGKRYFTWDKTKFPEPVAMQEKLAARGHNMVTIVDPHMKRDNGYHVHKHAVDQGLYVKKKDGTTDFDGWCWPGSSSYLDFTASHVRDFWAQQFSLDNYVGSTLSLYTWNDMNEPSVFNGPEVSMPKDSKSIAGVEHREWHNLYGFYQQAATADGLVKRHADANERPFVLSRAFFAGSQRFGAMWTGDNVASWDHLAIATPMLLTQGIAGFPFSGADVGGFFGNPEEELLVRWYQVAAYQPFFRAHAHLETKRREPWLFGEEILRLTRDAVLVRYALLPYLYTAYATAARTGLPVMRALWMHYPADAKAADMDTQFLCGEDLLVFPVTAKGLSTAAVYLPGGTSQPWYDVDDHSVSMGGQTVVTPLTLGKLPVFQRGGSIVPRKRRVRRSSRQMRRDPYTLTIAPDGVGAARGELYVDDEHSLDHTRGVFRRTEMQYGPRHGSGSDKLHMVLSASVLEGSFAADNTIERIEVLGVPEPPTRVSVVSDAKGGARPLTFIYDVKTQVLIVRKPEVTAAAAYEIEFVF